MMAALALLLAAAAGMPVETQYSKKTLVAHRGASAYAPEHDRHTIRVLSPLRLVCVFAPALSGRETHDADGSYLPSVD